MFFPLLLIGIGAASITGAILGGTDDGDPAEPIELPEVDEDASPPPPPPTQPTPITDVDADDLEALARVLASEAGSGTHGEQTAIGWTVRNRFRNGSIYSGAGKNAQGEYPWRSQTGSNPPFSSARDATDATRTIAQQILTAPVSSDPTGGATAFFEPKMQDAFYAAGVAARAGQTGSMTVNGVKMSDITRFKNYKHDAAGIREQWGPGSCLYAVAGRFEFWGSTSQFNKKSLTVQTILGSEHGMADPKDAYTDIPDPLLLLPKYKKRG